jgi:proteasome assembly chaperone (PAC2) family protein
MSRPTWPAAESLEAASEYRDLGKRRILMTDLVQLKQPWMVAVWPGMGQVALSAGYYLMAKLQMTFLGDFSPPEQFDIEHIQIENGLIRPGQRPRSRLFYWRDPHSKHDMVVFIGEAQPPRGKYAFCQQLIEFAKELNVHRVFTFAAMATQMHPGQNSRVFGATTDQESLNEIRRLDLEILQDGQIGGLNGVLLGAAYEANLPGTCLLGEIPHVFAQAPFPRASLHVLETFTSLADIEIDLTELAEQAEAMEKQLGHLLERVNRAMEPDEEEEHFDIGLPEEPKISAEDEQRIESLFRQAAEDRSKAYELKRELDRLEVFADYEDRFLDLFSHRDH